MLDVGKISSASASAFKCRKINPKFPSKNALFG